MLGKFRWSDWLRTLFVNSACPSGRLIAMFTAYFDASGNAQDDTFVVVSGYLANYLQWRMLETMWKDIHSEFGVELPFHMSEFMAATVNPDRYALQKNCRKDYLAIVQGDPTKAQTFFNRICIAQQSVVHCGISCIVDMRIYNGVSSLLNLREVLPPYALAARSCLLPSSSAFGVHHGTIEQVPHNLF